jgi:hypothetical protein
MTGVIFNDIWEIIWGTFPISLYEDFSHIKKIWGKKYEKVDHSKKAWKI